MSLLLETKDLKKHYRSRGVPGAARDVGVRQVHAAEPVDSRTSGEIMALLKQLHEREGKTVIMVTHDPALAARYAHRTITLLDGAIIPDSAA